MPKTLWDAWGKPAKPARHVTLRFGAGKERKTLRNFSAATRLDDCLFLAADEGAALDRLSRGPHHTWSGHVRHDLSDFLPLTDAGAEADLEGLAADEDWLWVLGSHSRTRPKPEEVPGGRIDLKKLADLNDTHPRCLLGRIPLVADGKGWQPVARDGGRRAGLLPQDKEGNAIARALRADPLIGPFTAIPAKEGGLDIEGIAVSGDRVVLGLRGPVIGTQAVLLELRVEARRSGELALAGAPVRRLLALEGLGIRDLKRHGDDLYILAGPTTGLSGPCALYRWRGWADDPPHDPSVVEIHCPDRLLELPFGRGHDHPEGLAIWKERQGRAKRILVMYDKPAKGRFADKGRSIVMDVFDLPE